MPVAARRAARAEGSPFAPSPPGRETHRRLDGDLDRDARGLHAQEPRLPRDGALPRLRRPPPPVGRSALSRAPRAPRAELRGLRVRRVLRAGRLPPLRPTER